MKTQKVISLITLACGAGILTGAPLGPAFTYQGRLNDGANPVTGTYDLRFTIYDSPHNPGTLIAGPVTNSATSLSNGLFTVALDFGVGVFTGEARWLEIAVRTNGGGMFTALTPRQPLTPSPYALYASNAGAAATAASAASAANVATNGVATTSLQANAVTTDKIADGTITSADLSSAVRSNTFWRLGGNVNVAPDQAFLGTGDGQPLGLLANGFVGLRLEFASNVIVYPHRGSTSRADRL